MKLVDNYQNLSDLIFSQFPLETLNNKIKKKNKKKKKKKKKNNII